MAKQRKHGSGTVRLRSDGRWEGRVVIGYDDKGLPKTKNVLAKTKAECEKKLKSLIAAQKESEPQPPRQTMTVAQWLDFWYQTYKKSNLRPNTQMSYERRIYQHIIPNLGPIPLNKFTTGDIQQFYTGLKQNGRLLRQEQYSEGLSDQTVRGIHTTFHAALDKAVSEKIIPTSAASPLQKPEKCRFSPRRRSNGCSFRPKRTAASNCSCWNCPLDYAVVRSAPSNGMT